MRRPAIDAYQASDRRERGSVKVKIEPIGAALAA